MNINDAFTSTYLKAADLKGGSKQAIISGFTNDDKIEKPIVLFQNATKGWVLNKTNALTIAASYGDDMELWIGHPVELFSAMVPFEGKNVEAIRCRIPTTVAPVAPAQALAAAPAPALPTPQGPGEAARSIATDPSDMNDPIPF